MAKFMYRTRGNSNPQGKPRVYFCCHPEDFERYFERVSGEILAKQNCAVWYLEDMVVVRDADLFADLKQMQLFVMPVTANLLCSENIALNVEFKFAIENHIPVLPLMQESGLEELFNKKCGDLQFLDKYNTDATSISYDEKLQKYLETVLIGDELAKKIRAAFDAYVFLSYRKKDRKYAQKLMRLIHKNKFCRNIAIWYDEFLSPGENFNDSIKEALKKSDLFVLTVTPNLISETNYIMTTEYPMAKQEGKFILPAELVPTDRKKLSERYEDIPEPADAYNESVLSEALLGFIEKMATKENGTSPEHSFFIGLAYLGGVDVEVDHERAVSLITMAADEGLVEAIEKLVTMYDLGIGTARSFEKKIQYQNKLIFIYQKQYRENPCKDTFLLLSTAMSTLARFYIDVKDDISAANIWKQLQENSAVIDTRKDDLDLVAQATILNTELHQAELLEKNGNTTEALQRFVEIFTKGKNLLRERMDISGVPSLLLGTIIVSGTRCVALYLEFDQMDQAVAMGDYLDGLIQAMYPVEGVQLSTAFAGALLTIGNLFFLIEGFEEAEECYQRAISCSEIAADITNGIEERHNWAIAHKETGLFYKKRKQFETAKIHFLTALPVCEELFEKQNSFYQGKDIVQLHRELASIAQSDDDRKQHLCDAHETAKQLFGLYGNQVVFLLFDVTKEWIAYLLPQDSIWAEDIFWITAQMVFKKAEELPILEQVYDFSNQCSEYMRNYVDTDVCYWFCVEAAKLMVEKQDNVHYRTALKYAYFNRAQQNLSKGEVQRAAEYFSHAITESSILYEQTGEIQHLFEKGMCYVWLACFCVDEHKIEIVNRVRDVIKILENHSPQGSEQAQILETALNNILKTPN